MKERPILFNGEMVRAILDGRKTQTRRIVKNRGERPDFRGGRGDWSDPEAWGWECGESGQHIFMTPRSNGEYYHCPFRVGDQLWVRETWCTSSSLDHAKPSNLLAGAPIQFLADQSTNVNNREDIPLVDPGKVRPSIFMPRWASRIQLRITDVRVERLQDISEEDAMAEGIIGCDINVGYDNPQKLFAHYGAWVRTEKGIAVDMNMASKSPIIAFRYLWSSINGPKSWDYNPWLWVVEFERIKP